MIYCFKTWALCGCIIIYLLERGFLFELVLLFMLFSSIVQWNCCLFNDYLSDSQNVLFLTYCIFNDYLPGSQDLLVHYFEITMNTCQIDKVWCSNPLQRAMFGWCSNPLLHHVCMESISQFHGADFEKCPFSLQHLHSCTATGRRDLNQWDIIYCYDY